MCFNPCIVRVKQLFIVSQIVGCPVIHLITAQLAEMSVTVNNSPIQDYVLLDDHTQLTHEMTNTCCPGNYCVNCDYLI